MDHKAEYEKLDQVVITQNETGLPVLRFAVQAQLYLTGGALSRTRQTVIDVFDSFRRLAPDRITHLKPNLENRLLPISTLDFPAFYYAEIDRQDVPDMVFCPHLTSVPAVPPQYQARAHLTAADDGPDAISELDLAVPPSFVQADPDRYLAQVLDWCARLQPMHGQAGFAPVYENGAETEHMRETWPYLARFPGLSYPLPYPIAAEGHGHRRISGTNWLTILDNRLLEELGGAAHLPRRLAEAWATIIDQPAGTDLPPGVTLHEYDGGVVIRAGEHPQLGDVNMGNIPETYRTVSAALRPWRFEDYQQNPMDLIRVPRPLDAYEETLNWLGRFDLAD